MTSPTKLWYLENLRLLHTLSSSEMHQLHDRSLMQAFAKGETIYFAGDNSDSVFLLKTGKVKIAHCSLLGQEVIMSLLCAGDLFGELALTDSGQRGEEAVALEETLVCKVEIGFFNALMSGNAQLNLEVTKLLGLRLRKVQSRLSDLVFKSAEQRVRGLLRELAQEHGTWVANDPNQVVIKLRLTHHDLARLAATSRQTITTLLNTLEREGVLLHNRRHLFIKRLSDL